MEAHIVLPSEYSDTIYLFICFLIFFWLFKALKRFYRTFLLRQAYNTDSIVQIQGLGSYLSYFDGATSAHLHSIVHTRQTKPPIEMPMIVVPCSLLKTIISLDSANHDRSILEIQFHAAVPGKLILMSNFNMNKFKHAVGNALGPRKRNHQNNHHHHSHHHNSSFFIENHHRNPAASSSSPSTVVGLGVGDHHHHRHQSNVSFRDSLFSLDQQSITSLADTRKCRLLYLAEQEVCDRACAKYDCTIGTQTIQFTFLNPRLVGTAPAVPSRLSENGRTNGNTPTPTPTPTPQPANPVPPSNQIFTIGIAFLPTSTDHAPKIRPNSSDLIRDRDTLSRSFSGDGPSSNPPIYEESTKEPARPATGFLNFRNYFSIGSTDNARSNNNSTKALVAPEPSLIPEHDDVPNQYSPTEASDPSSKHRNHSHSYPENLNLKSEVTSVSIFTFQFPANIASLFQQQEEGSTNPVIERSSKRGSKAINSPNSNNIRTISNQSKEVLPKELTIMDKHGKLYNSLEIFGLGSMNEGGRNITVDTPVIDPSSTIGKEDSVKSPESTGRTRNSTIGKSRSSDVGDLQDTSPNTKKTAIVKSNESDIEAGAVDGNSPVGEGENSKNVPVTPSTSAIFQGGKFTKEECVVCLTEPKTVVLLPCSSCLIYVDKCPVCRAFFEEYVIIQSDNSISVTPN